MPHPQQPDPAPPPPGKPICPACGKLMLLAVAKPSHFINIRECTYRCACGEEGDYLVADEE